MAVNGTIWIVLGPPGAGKSIQANMLAKELEMEYVSTGEICRASDDPDVKEMVAHGDLVPSEIMQRLLIGHLNNVPVERSIILDGFPRLVDEAEWLLQIASNLKHTLGEVIFLDVSRDTAIARLVGRGRADDSTETMQRRFDLYEEETLPVIELFKKSHRLVCIDGDRSIELVYPDLLAAIGEGKK